MDGNPEAGVSTGLFRFTVPPESQGTRIDRFLPEAARAAGLTLSRTYLQALLADGHVGMDGQPVREPKTKVRAGADVQLVIPPPVSDLPAGEDIPLSIVFEDDHLVVIDKPAGLVVHPAPGNADGTLVNALIAHCGDSLSGIGGVRRPGIVHRLDKDTSGLLVVAKTDQAHQGLSAIFADHGRSGSLVRAYQAFVWGVPDRRSGTVEFDIGRDPYNRQRMAALSRTKGGRHAVTHWDLEDAFGAAALVHCRLETGRTHQIRVHLTSLGHPLIGDATYGAGFRTKATLLPDQARAVATGIGRQALHAATLGFDHPITGETLRFHSPLPPDLRALHDALRANI